MKVTLEEEEEEEEEEGGLEVTPACSHVNGADVFG